MAHDWIAVRGARVHNLKNIDVELPRDKLIVITGMSGSGKSSLAFDTIYAEGQRRLLASMSTFAKRFVGQLKKPDVDFVNGLSPVVSIDQKTIGANPRSTVGTMTDISDYLRMLFATMGTPHCPLCGEAIAVRTPYQMMEHLLSLPRGTEVEVRAQCTRSMEKTTSISSIKFALTAIGGRGLTANRTTWATTSSWTKIGLTRSKP